LDRASGFPEAPIRQTQPVPFFSDGDEGYFFQSLKSIDTVKDFVGVPPGLEVTLTDPVDDFSLGELLRLTTRYGLDMKWLRNLRNQQNEEWFAEEMTVWYGSVFKD
jgi:hypothetical protein